MPQSVSIQIDNVVNTKPAQTKEVAKDKSFSETLDKHINTTEQKSAEANKTQTKSVESRDNKPTDKTEKDEAATVEADAKTEKNDIDDGKKLPSDEKVSDKEASDDSESNSAESENNVETVVSPATFGLAQEPETKASSTTSDKNTGAEGEGMVAAKKTVIETSVAQNTAPKTQSPSSIDANSEANLANKKQTDASLVTVTDTEKAVIKQTQNTNQGENVPNFAKALQSMNEADSKTSEIRADIMDAIKRQRQRGDGEQVATVRNMMAAQAESKDKADVDLLGIRADKTIQERLVNVSPTASSTSTSSAATASTSTATAANATVSLPVQPNIQSSAWSQVMNSRVVWMAKEGIQQAEMKMNPANLGPVEVKLHVHNDQASVTFLAQHSATRDALEQALPKLRDSFAENGIQLTHAEVGQQQHQQQKEEQPQQMQNSQNFTQANRQNDDIMNEAEETLGSAIEDSGLSLYV